MTGRPDDRGLSLVEVVIAMSLSGLVAALAVPVVIGTSRAVRAADTAVVRTADVRNALEAMTRSLRTAVKPAGEPAALVVAQSTGLTAYALVNRSGAAQTTDPVPVLVSYGYDGSCLTETVTAGTRATGGATGFTWTATPRSRCLLRTGVAPTFSYYSVAAVAVGGADTPAMAVPAGGITEPTALASITAVQVTLTARPSASSPATTLVGRVTLGNVISGAVAS